MDGANENGCACWSGCLACLSCAWGFVKMIVCCRCRSSPVERDPEETSGVVSDYETSTPPTPARQARFRSVADVFLFVLPPLQRLRRRSTTDHERRATV